MKSMIKDAVILFVITLVAGLLLGGVYEITKAPIANQKALKKTQAFQEVFADASNFETLDEMTGKGNADATINEVAEAKDANGNSLGYVMDITTHGGYGGDIQFTLGIQNDGTINGISILSIAETPGLGMKAEEVIKPQFAGKVSKGFWVTKTGAATADEIDAIGGATVTSNAMVNGVNAGIDLFYSDLGGGTNE